MRTFVALAIALTATPAASRCWKAGQNVSWYGEAQRLPNGRHYNPDAETCASREHPAGTLLRVVDLDTGLGVDCAVNDWGPAAWTRCRLDLSRKSAERVGMKARGVIRARIEVLAEKPRRLAETKNPGRSSPGPGIIAPTPLF